MTSPVTHKLTLTHRELSLIVRGLRAVKAQIDFSKTTMRGAGVSKDEEREVEELRLRMAAIYNKDNQPPYPYG